MWEWMPGRYRLPGGCGPEFALSQHFNAQVRVLHRETLFKGCLNEVGNVKTHIDIVIRNDVFLLYSGVYQYGNDGMRLESA